MPQKNLSSWAHFAKTTGESRVWPKTEKVIYSLNLLYIMIEEDKCRHLFEYVMGSKVCKRCGLMERYRSPVYA